MRVSHNEPDLLIVDDRPIFMGLFFIPFFFIFISIGISLLRDWNLFGLIWVTLAFATLLVMRLVLQRVQVVFHRPEDWMEFRTRTARGTRTVRHKLSEISHAELISHSGQPPTHRVDLIIPEGESAGSHPVTNYLSSSKKHADVADAINAWLKQ